MTDPFQNVSAAGAAFIETIAEGLEARAADPSMVPIIEAYLDAIDWSVSAAPSRSAAAPARSRE
jgi:hypothetical protein